MTTNQTKRDLQFTNCRYRFMNVTPIIIGQFKYPGGKANLKIFAYRVKKSEI
jgi:hypothetical protein